MREIRRYYLDNDLKRAIAISKLGEFIRLANQEDSDILKAEKFLKLVRDV